MRRYQLMMFPWGLGKVGVHGGHFDTLGDALDEARKHADCEYEVWDHDHGGALVASSGGEVS